MHYEYTKGTNTNSYEIENKRHKTKTTSYQIMKRINISVTLVSESYVILYCEKKCNM